MDKRKWLNVSLSAGIIVACVLVGCGIAQKEQSENSDSVVVSDESSKEENSKETTQEDATAEEEAFEAENKASEEDTDKKETLVNENISCIGDSVMLGAKEEMLNRIPNVAVDAEESRQMSEAKSIISTLKGNDTLGGRVVIALGTNGIFTEKSGQALIDEIGPERKIYWVNVFGSNLEIQEQVNGIIATLAEKNEQVTELFWDKHAQDHSEWFYNDGIHLNGAGRIAYAKFILDAVEKETEE